MLQILRKALVAVLFAILIGAFALWGVARYINQPPEQQTIASVGGIAITPRDFQDAYRNARENLSERAGRNISLEQARALGLPQEVMRQLVQDTALEAEAGHLGLGLSADGLREVITHQKVFFENGKFSPEKYRNSIERTGYSPEVYERKLRGDLIRQQLAGLFTHSAVVPQELLEAYNKYLNEQRALSYFILDANAAGAIPAPSPEALRAYYDEHATKYVSPETRKVEVVAVDAGTASSKVAVSDADLRAVYDKKAASYAVPERRKVEIIPFPAKPAADAASAQLAAGKDFLDVAKEAGFKQSEIDAGLLSKKDLAAKWNEKIASAAFALDKGKVSAPVEGDLGTAIVRVLEILPSQQKTFDEVKEQVRTDVTKERVGAEVAKLTKAFEDARATGVPIPDIAKKLDLPVNDVVLDGSGKGPDGKPVAVTGVPADALAKGAFASDVGVENDALRLPSGGYAWYDVVAITKQRQKPFDEVKAEVEADWHKHEVRTKLIAKAHALSEQAAKGEAIANLAKGEGTEVKTSRPLKRGDVEPGLPLSVVDQAFALADGGAASAVTGGGTSSVVFQVTKVTPPAPLDAVTAENIRSKLAEAIANDNTEQFIAGIETALGTTVNRKAISELAGGKSDVEE